MLARQQTVVSQSRAKPDVAVDPQARIGGYSATLMARCPDAVGTAGDFDLASHFQAFAVEANDRKRVIDHALRQQRLAVTAPGDALRPLADVNFGDLGKPGAIDAENDEQTMIVVERMARRQIRAVLRNHSQKLAIV